MDHTSLSAVVIDFDDTLYLSEEACFQLENEVLSRMGRPAQSREIHKQTWGMPVEDGMKLRSPGIDTTEFWEVMKPTHQEFVTNGHIDVVSEDNLSALDELATAGYQLFIVTSRTHAEVEHLLDPSHHLAGRIAEIYHADSTTHIKPDPRVFDHMLREHSLKPQQCVYVGDSIGDGIAANKAGMKFIVSFESGLRTPDDFNAVHIDEAIQRFTDLPAAIRSL